MAAITRVIAPPAAFAFADADAGSALATWLAHRPHDGVAGPCSIGGGWEMAAIGYAMLVRRTPRARGVCAEAELRHLAQRIVACEPPEGARAFGRAGLLNWLKTVRRGWIGGGMFGTALRDALIAAPAAERLRVWTIPAEVSASPLRYMRIQTAALIVAALTPDATDEWRMLHMPLGPAAGDDALPRWPHAGEVVDG